ncbi:MAG: DUF814 domain-containing protein [Candidatus Eisenbacteria bacterium]|uniref:DUF814 domain-containing protein n=1 Tax=Eiseniibacteriota bacterium TaxID=2212470 RepID=A0A938BLI2_UNCEI|nr:DUF814 domain-containing protein [Candidatus Eisenbacteria bacterium]
MAPTHAELVAALRTAIAGRAAILDAHTEGVEQVVLLIGGDDGTRHELHLLLLDPRPCFWLERAARRGRAEGGGFDDWLRRHVAGARIAGVGAGLSGRILRLDLRCPAPGAFDPLRAPGTPRFPALPAALILDPLPGAARLLVLDAGGDVIQRYPPTAHGEPRGRGAPGSRYAEPRASRVTAEEEDGNGADGGMGAAAGRGADGGSAAGADSGADAGSGTGAAPAVAGSSAGSPPAADPDELFRVARERAAAVVGLARAAECVRRVRRILRAERDRLARLQVKLDAELEQARGGGDCRRQAEALLAHARRVPRGARSVALEDPGQPERVLTIALDPRLGFSENAKRLFRKAARLERSLPLREAKAAQAARLAREIESWLALPALAEPPPPNSRKSGAAAGSGALVRPEDAIDGLMAALQEARRRLAQLDPGLRRSWAAAVDRWREALAGLDRPLNRPGFEARRPAPEEAVAPAARPRRFSLPGGWEVLVGRSNRENDLLTHRIARPGDLWLHARGAAGSHVVLRATARGAKPSKAIIDRAAAVAAYYSKARTSALVPVVYTEKRYVRKPRKGAPGLAVCLRESVTMVKPALPEE